MELLLQNAFDCACNFNLSLKGVQWNEKIETC